MRYCSDLAAEGVSLPFNLLVSWLWSPGKQEECETTCSVTLVFALLPGWSQPGSLWLPRRCNQGPLLPGSVTQKVLSTSKEESHWLLTRPNSSGATMSLIYKEYTRHGPHLREMSRTSGAAVGSWSHFFSRQRSMKKTRKALHRKGKQ